MEYGELLKKINPVEQNKFSKSPSRFSLAMKLLWGVITTGEQAENMPVNEGAAVRISCNFLRGIY